MCFCRYSSIPNLNYDKLHSKTISTLVQRLSKKFNLSKEWVPNANIRQIMGGLRYLVHKKYSEDDIGKIIYKINYLFIFNSVEHIENNLVYFNISQHLLCKHTL